MLKHFFEELINFLCETFAIAMRLGRANRKCRLFCSTMWAGLTVAIAAFVYNCNAVIRPCLTYIYYSCMIQDWECYGYANRNWDGYNYWFATKQDFIRENFMASILNKLAENSLGDLIQTAILTFAVISALALVILFAKCLFEIHLVSEEIYLNSHRRSGLYRERLNDLIRDTRSMKVSSKELRNHRLFDIYKNHPYVIELMEEKKKREAKARAKARTHKTEIIKFRHLA